MTPRFTAALLPILLLAAAGWRPGPPVWTIGAVAPLQPAAPSIRDTVARLDSDDPKEVTRARAELLKPLDGAPVDFRIKYSGELIPELSALSGRTKRDTTLINVMMIAGDVATDPASDLVERFRADQRIAVRFAAVLGFKRTFDASAQGQPPLTVVRANAIVDALANQAADEPSPEILDAIVRALASAAQAEPLAGLRDRSIAAMSEKVGARLKKIANQREAPELKAALRAGGVVRDALINLNAQPLRDETRARAAQLAGHLMAHVVVRLRAGEYPPIAAGDPPEKQEAARAARKTPADLVGVSETIVSLAVQGLPQLGLAQSFREGSAAGDQRVTLEGVRLLNSLREKLALPPDFFIKPG